MGENSNLKTDEKWEKILLTDVKDWICAVPNSSERVLDLFLDIVLYVDEFECKSKKIKT